jgi:ABC-type transport system involved in multi-copper enzyme maturation permease subunit
MAFVLFAVHAAYGREPEIGIFVASAGIYLELVLLVCLASLFSTFTTPVLSAIFTLSMFLVGHVSKDLLSFGGRSTSDTVRTASKVLFYLLPNLENFNWKNEVVYGGARSLAVPGLATGYLALYGAGVLVLACLLFSRKDFK